VILIDTSAWVEYLRGTDSAADRRVDRLIAERAEIATTDAVLMEVLAGARSSMHRDNLRRLLAGCEYVATDGPADWERAADLYRVCRKAGATVRALNDCLIAAVALRSGASVLHKDADFDVIARHAELAIA
jgi:predicted nucleic acid-binding protein